MWFMMKTLKDFPERVAWFKEISVIPREDLKQEAIKWIKEFDRLEINNLNTPLELQDFEDDDVGGFYEVRNWIKHFFNITDEELEKVK